MQSAYLRIYTVMSWSNTPPPDIQPYIDVAEEAGRRAYETIALQGFNGERINFDRMSTLQRAIEIATEAHKGQFDKAGSRGIFTSGDCSTQMCHQNVRE